MKGLEKGCDGFLLIFKRVYSSNNEGTIKAFVDLKKLKRKGYVAMGCKIRAKGLVNVFKYEWQAISTAKSIVKLDKTVEWVEVIDRASLVTVASIKKDNC